MTNVQTMYNGIVAEGLTAALVDGWANAVNIGQAMSANMRHWSSVGLMLGRWHKWWSNINPCAAELFVSIFHSFEAGIATNNWKLKFIYEK